MLITNLQGQINVHITAMDKDYTDGADDLLDKLSHTFYVTPGSSSSAIMTGTRPITDKSQFTLKVSVTCESTWSGNDCNTGAVTLFKVFNKFTTSSLYHFLYVEIYEKD